MIWRLFFSVRLLRRLWPWAKHLHGKWNDIPPEQKERYKQQAMTAAAAAKSRAQLTAEQARQASRERFRR